MGSWAVARVSGPLASFDARYRSWLVAQGYRSRSIEDLIWQLDGLSRWLERERLAVGQLTPERVEQFEAARLAAGYCARWARCTRLPLRFLRGIGAAPEPVAADGPVERLLAGYCSYLARERGLAVGTIYNYERAARLFLSDCLERDGLALERLTTADVSGFLARELPKRNVPGALQCGNGTAPRVALSARGGVDRDAVAMGGPGGVAGARPVAGARAGPREAQKAACEL